MNPRIGVAAIVQNGEWKILFAKRKGNHGPGFYAPPGGHLELSETIVECARRECLEETGLQCHGGRILSFTEDVFSPEKHYVTFFVLFSSYSGEVSTREPDKAEIWDWHSLDNLPDPLFLPVVHFLEQWIALQ